VLEHRSRPLNPTYAGSETLNTIVEQIAGIVEGRCQR
jgi:hypothetical protein